MRLPRPRPREEEPRDIGFKEFLEEHGVGLFRLAVSLAGGDRLQAEEYHQETLGRVYRAWKTVENHPNPVAYARTTMRNILRDHYRRRKRNSVWVSTDPVIIDLDPVMDLGVDASRIETKLYVQQLVRKLSMRERQVIYLRFYSDLTIDEAANTLKVSTGTIKSAQSMAIKKLRTMIKGTEEVGK